MLKPSIMFYKLHVIKSGYCFVCVETTRWWNFGTQAVVCCLLRAGQCLVTPSTKRFVPISGWARSWGATIIIANGRCVGSPLHHNMRCCGYDLMVQKWHCWNIDRPTRWLWNFCFCGYFSSVNCIPVVPLIISDVTLPVVLFSDT